MTELGTSARLRSGIILQSLSTADLFHGMLHDRRRRRLERPLPPTAPTSLFTVTVRVRPEVGLIRSWFDDLSRDRQHGDRWRVTCASTCTAEPLTQHNSRNQNYCNQHRGGFRHVQNVRSNRGGSTKRGHTSHGMSDSTTTFSGL